jgi:hypothetical protein
MTFNMATVRTFSLALIFLAVTRERCLKCGSNRTVTNMATTYIFDEFKADTIRTNQNSFSSSQNKKKNNEALGSDTLTVLSARREM